MRENSFRRIIQNFIMNMESIQNTLTPESSFALTEPCVFLRIGMIRADFFETPRAYAMENGQPYILYNTGDVDETNEFTMEKDTKVGTKIIYHVFGLIDEEPWTDEEIERLDVLIKMLFVFNGRSRLMIANYKLTFYDQDMQASNTSSRQLPNSSLRMR